MAELSDSDISQSDDDEQDLVSSFTQDDSLENEPLEMKKPKKKRGKGKHHKGNDPSLMQQDTSEDEEELSPKAKKHHHHNKLAHKGKHGVDPKTATSEELDALVNDLPTNGNGSATEDANVTDSDDGDYEENVALNQDSDSGSEASDSVSEASDGSSSDELPDDLMEDDGSSASSDPEDEESSDPTAALEADTTPAADVSDEDE